MRRIAALLLLTALVLPAHADWREAAPGGVVNTFKGVDTGGGVQAPVTAGRLSDYPNGATPLTNSATGTTSATATSLAGAVGKTTYICGFEARANATAAVTGNLTIAGTIIATLNFTVFTPANTAGTSVVGRDFSKCIPGNATNTAITVTYPAPGAGGVVSVSVWGYQL